MSNIITALSNKYYSKKQLILSNILKNNRVRRVT